MPSDSIGSLTRQRSAKPFRQKIVKYKVGRTQVRAGTPGAIREESWSPTWYGSINGKQVSLHTSDEGLARERLAALRADTSREGLPESPDVALAVLLRAKARRDATMLEVGRGSEAEDPADLKGVAQAKARQFKRLAHVPGYVYLLLAENGLCKIGQTADPAQRLRNFDFYPLSVWPLHLIVSDSMSWLESHLHLLFRKKRVRGEWFRLTLADVGMLMSVSKVSRTDGDDLDAIFTAYPTDPLATKNSVLSALPPGEILTSKHNSNPNRAHNTPT